MTTLAKGSQATYNATISPTLLGEVSQPFLTQSGLSNAVFTFLQQQGDLTIVSCTLTSNADTTVSTTIVVTLNSVMLDTDVQSELNSAVLSYFGSSAGISSGVSGQSGQTGSVAASSVVTGNVNNNPAKAPCSLIDQLLGNNGCSFSGISTGTKTMIGVFAIVLVIVLLLYFFPMQGVNVARTLRG
jgi:hypothetical protein